LREGVHQQATDTTKSWGLPFPFLITFMLWKKGIKGIAADGPISDHPHFRQIQWNQSYSHMPRGHRARATDEQDMMDIEEPAAQPEPSAQPEAAVDPDAADDKEEGEEYEETITISASDLVALQDTLDDMRSKIDNIERDAHQAQLKVKERF
jgi:hypothetical protein